MAIPCYDGDECDGCYSCLPELPLCCICGRPVGPYDDVIQTERGPVCDSVDCRFEAAMEESDEDLLREYAENDKDSYVEFVFGGAA